MTLSYGTPIKSLRCDKKGIVVGWGTLQWPHGENANGDGGVPQPVYLVQLSDGPFSFIPGSSSLGPACAVFRADQIEVVG